MTDFFKKFLLEDTKRVGAGGRYAGLAAFGKHPGWDDHVEDLGLETDSLNSAKTSLYVNGIGGQIDSGAWEKLDSSQQLPEFKHIFLWQRSGQILVGRLWSSSDGKGRKRYPMVVCIHFNGVTLGWALKQALPVLAELEQRCRQATTAGEVRALLDTKRAALRDAIQNGDSNGEYAPVMPAALHEILHPGGDVKAEGFVRVLYQIQSQLAAFAPGTFNARNISAANRAQQIRVPVGSQDPQQALLFWTRFFLTQVDPAVPLLLILPLGETWLDITVGEPESHEFFSLRATPRAVPLVSEVPYTMDEAFREKARKFLADFKQGDTTAKQVAPAAEPVSNTGDTRSVWRKWLGAGLFLVLVAIAWFGFRPGVGNKKSSVITSGNASNAAATPRAALSVSALPIVSNAPAQVEADRLAAEKKQAEELAVANLKAEAAAKEKAEAAAKEKARLQAEADRLAAEKKQREEVALAAKMKEQAAAAEKALQEQKAKAAEEAKQKAEQARLKLKALASTNLVDPVPDSTNTAKAK